MSAAANQLELLLGRAALQLWPDLPRDVQEKLFEAAVPVDPALRNPDHLAGAFLTTWSCQWPAAR